MRAGGHAHHGRRVYSAPRRAAPLMKIWQLLRPIALANAYEAGTFMWVATSTGHRGAALAGHGLVVMPMKAVWLVIALVIAANLYALAGLLGSGALLGVASGTVSSATRTWRK